MKLYSHVGNFEKIDILVHEMGEKGIFGDNYTFTIHLQAYAASSDCDKIDMIMTRIESDPMIVMDCHTLAAAATALLKVGSVDRSLKMLHKLERLLKTYNRRSFWFNVLLILYGQIGKKDELYRVWDLYKKEKIINKGYMNMINSLLMCDDIEGAEKIFEEWESRGLSYDFRVPNYLIDAYIKNGDLVKAESLLNQGLAKGGKPSFYTWYLMASGYIEHNEVVHAVEALKKAILVFPPTWKYSKDNMVICLGFLEGRGDVEKAEEIVRLAEMVPILSATEKRFHRFIKDQISKLKECNRKEHSG